MIAAPTLPAPRPEWAYFFDVDGTLLELASSPDAVHPDAQVGAMIDRLGATTGGAVALITGRTIRDIERLFPKCSLAIAGQHGAERRHPEGSTIDVATLPAVRLEPARRALRGLVARHPGLLLEDKGASLALHYRAAPQLGGVAHLVMRSLQLALGPGYAVQRGKRVVELRPAGADKGAAILAFMHEPPFAGRCPVFVGDDASDEHGFAVVNALDGQSVKVGPGATLARWRLPDVRAVRRWLEQEPVTMSASVTHSAEAL